MSTTPLLDTLANPEDLRRLKESQLRQLADELRYETINAVSLTGGHLGAGLGVIELTVAIHYIFDTPRDRLIWDVGHQAYPHKIVTGRRDRIRTVRAAVFPDLPSVPKVTTTISVRRTVRHQSRQGLGWLSRGILKAATTM